MHMNIKKSRTNNSVGGCMFSKHACAYNTHKHTDRCKNMHALLHCCTTKTIVFKSNLLPTWSNNTYANTSTEK